MHCRKTCLLVTRNSRELLFITQKSRLDWLLLTGERLHFVSDPEKNKKQTKKKPLQLTFKT